jgi:hypothetical protein
MGVGDASDTILSGDARLNRLEGKEEVRKNKKNLKPTHQNLLNACDDKVGMPLKVDST